MNDDKIKKIYQKLINLILDGFSADERNIACQEYYNILINRYSSIDIDENKFIKIIEIEYNEWKDLGLGARKHILLKDNVLKEIVNLTGQGYKWAEERVNNNSLVSVEIAEKYINRINQLLPLVQEYNKELANWYVSEGTMDLLYACGKTDNTSLRIGRYK